MEFWNFGISSSGNFALSKSGSPHGHFTTDFAPNSENPQVDFCHHRTHKKVRENHLFPHSRLKDAKMEFGQMSKIPEIPEFCKKWSKTARYEGGMRLATSKFDRHTGAGLKTLNTTWLRRQNIGRARDFCPGREKLRNSFFFSGIPHSRLVGPKR